MRVAFFSDTHIGYATRCPDTPAGINTRVQDGYDGLRATITDILDHDVDAVLHGGDMFHVSHPQIGDIVHVQQQLARLAGAGIPVFGISGNHDASAHRSKMSATAALDNPDAGIHFPDDPYTRWVLADGITVHGLAHLGVIHDSAHVHPDDHDVSLLLSHGVAAIPGHELFSCADSPGEAVLDYELLTNPQWNGIFLGHYHQRGDIVGLARDTAPAMYAGSLLRRGFSDPAGDRGWTELTIHPTGEITTCHHNIAQRPQYDLPVIDAAAVHAGDLTDVIIEQVSSIDAAGAIVRQRVINITAAERQLLRPEALTPHIEQALQWILTFTSPTQTTSISWKAPETTSLVDTYTHWLPTYITDNRLPEDTSAYLYDHSVRYLREQTGS